MSEFTGASWENQVSLPGRMERIRLVPSHHGGGEEAGEGKRFVLCFHCGLHLTFCFS